MVKLKQMEKAVSTELKRKNLVNEQVGFLFLILWRLQ